MNMNDRVKQAVNDSHEWFPKISHQMKDVAFWSLCIGGEIGELQNWIKKWMRGSKTWAEVREVAAEELVDVFVYAFNLAEAFDMDLEKEYDRKRRHNQNRFGNQSSDGQSGTRAANPGSSGVLDS